MYPYTVPPSQPRTPTPLLRIVSHATEARTPHELERTTGAGHNWRIPDPCVLICLQFCEALCVVRRDGDGNVVRSAGESGAHGGLEVLCCTLSKALGS